MDNKIHNCTTRATGYIFDISALGQSIAVASNVLFNSNGYLKYIMHTPGANSILINHTGIYKIAFLIYTAIDATQGFGSGSKWCNSRSIWS